MSKMGNELEKRLDANKYEVWEMLKDLEEGFPRDRWGDVHYHRRELIYKAQQLISKIENGGEL